MKRDEFTADDPPLAIAELCRANTRGGIDGMLAAAAEHFRRHARYHDLFDARLLAARLALGMPALRSAGWEDQPEAVQAKLESAYLEACREVGRLLAEAERFREAWMYLRPAGDQAWLAARIALVEPTPEQAAEWIEIASQHGVAPRLAVRWALAHYGTCHTISLVDGSLPGWNAAERSGAIAMLVDHLHAELRASLARDLAQRVPSATAIPSATVVELLNAYPELLADDNYHVDTSHLHSVVRLARLVDDRESLTRAVELTDYGARLGPIYQFRGEEPFADSYAAHRHFFAAQLGRQVGEAIAYFAERAEGAVIEESGTLPAETYVVLLVRLGRAREALEAHARLLPRGSSTSGFAPGLWELADRAGSPEVLSVIAESRGDVLAFVAAQVAVAQKQAAPP